MQRDTWVDEDGAEAPPDILAFIRKALARRRTYSPASILIVVGGGGDPYARFLRVNIPAIAGPTIPPGPHQPVNTAT